MYFNIKMNIFSLVIVPRYFVQKKSEQNKSVEDHNDHTGCGRLQFIKHFNRATSCEDETHEDRNIQNYQHQIS
jgi:hypothetical protein